MRKTPSVVTAVILAKQVPRGRVARACLLAAFRITYFVLHVKPGFQQAGAGEGCRCAEVEQLPLMLRLHHGSTPSPEIKGAGIAGRR
jgi:hypothetical protein